MNRNKGLTCFFIDESTGKFVLVFKFTLIDFSNLKFLSLYKIPFTMFFLFEKGLQAIVASETSIPN